MPDHYHYEYADERHDHDYEYAEKYHRHHDLEDLIEGLRADLNAAYERIAELEQASRLAASTWTCPACGSGPYGNDLRDCGNCGAVRRRASGTESHPGEEEDTERANEEYEYNRRHVEVPDDEEEES